ncbi:MAG: hypothetical protein KC416_05440, partial [Myxococcales bacterium]|nr:hypothetical protein [Myxococcales bacterium]
MFRIVLRSLGRSQSGLLGLALFVASGLVGCGAKTTSFWDSPDAETAPISMEELCNGLDDDLDSLVDEDFRDDGGRYLSDSHCGQCGSPCDEVP